MLVSKSALAFHDDLRLFLREPKRTNELNASEISCVYSI